MLFFTTDPIAKFIGWDWLNNLSIGSILLRLSLAIIFSGLIGVQRAQKRHAAGLRTYGLVCLGATIAMMTNEFLMLKFNTGDAGRLGAQVISGIGFLGAGTILVTSRNQIRGLTTAAGLWACACMGLAIGAGFYTLAIIGEIIIFISLILFPKIENYFILRTSTYELHIELDSRPNLKELVNYLRFNNIKIYSLEHNTAYSSSGLSVYTITINVDKSAEKVFKKHNTLVEEIKKLPYVNYVEIIY